MQEQENFENINEQEQEEVFSTVFSAPPVHKDKKKAGKHKLLVTVCAGLLSVAVLVGSIFGVIKLIPVLKKDDNMLSKNVVSENVFKVDPNSVSELVIENQYGTLNIVSQNRVSNIEAVETTVRVLLLKGYDENLIDSDSLSLMLQNAVSLDKYAQYDAQDEVFGLENPEVTITVSGQGFETYSIAFGSDTTDSVYCYAAISTIPNKVFVVKNSVKATFNKSAFDLAISDGIAPIEINEKTSKYFDESGALASFDTLVLDNKAFGAPITFVPNNDDLFNVYASFITITPQRRIADNINSLLNLFGTSTSSSGCVSFDQSAESLKKFGLDNPDITVTLSLGGEVYSYRLKQSSDAQHNYYVAASNDKMIRVVTVSNLEFVSLNEQDYYVTCIVVESIKNISAIEMSGDLSVKYDVEYDSDNEEYVVYAGDKKIDSDAFLATYSNLVSTEAVDISTVQTSQPVSLTIKLYHNDNSATTVITFRRISETRYQFYLGGIAMGQLTSTGYNNIVRDFRNLIEK